MKILITGAAGFIGFNFINFLLKKNKNIHVIGVDNLNDYYSVILKRKRLQSLKTFKKFKFYKLDISNFEDLNKIFKNEKIDVIFNFAAQAGVRYSILHPKKYNDYNIVGFFNLIELSRLHNIRKIFYASSSSVYGDSNDFPLKENLKLRPKNIYALSKKINEEMAELYSNLYKIKMTGLRFFTVYGEWGRPDMFIMKYIIASIKNSYFYLNNFGNHSRDFTYIKDVNNILYLLLRKSGAKKNHQIFNVCSSSPQKITKIIKILNHHFKKPKIKKLPLQLADVLKTHGSNYRIKKISGFKNFTKIDDGLKKISNWIKTSDFKF